MSSKSINITDFRSQIPGKLSDDRLTWCFPPIIANNHSWQIFVQLKRGDDLVIIKEEYFISKNNLVDFIAFIDVISHKIGGKVNPTTPTEVKAGKNIGKANATNVFTQALRDALSRYNKQLNKVEFVYPPPMLSEKFKEQKANIEYPVYLQRKYNGIRVVFTRSNDKIIAYSRRQNLFVGLNYLKEELEKVLTENDGLYIDGEVYEHNVPLQEISGATRKETDKAKYSYMAYDCFHKFADNNINDPTLYVERKKFLDSLFDKYQFTYTKNVDTVVANNEEEVEQIYDRFVEEGYEGAMVRLNKDYEFSLREKHSRKLLKMKPLFDAEYEIVDWSTGDKGKASDMLMIICKTESGTTFPVTPSVDHDRRRELVKLMQDTDEFEKNWKGKKLIVYYDELSKDNVPLRTKTKLEIRDWD